MRHSTLLVGLALALTVGSCGQSAPERESQQYVSLDYAMHCTNGLLAAEERGQVGSGGGALVVPWSIQRVGGTDAKPVLECAVRDGDRARYVTVEVACPDHGNEQCTSFLKIEDSRAQ